MGSYTCKTHQDAANANAARACMCKVLVSPKTKSHDQYHLVPPPPRKAGSAHQSSATATHWQCLSSKRSSQMGHRAKNGSSQQYN